MYIFISLKQVYFFIEYQAKKIPYFVARTVNHMLPVYMETEIRGEGLITYLINEYSYKYLIQQSAMQLMSEYGLVPNNLIELLIVSYFILQVLDTLHTYAKFREILGR